MYVILIHIQKLKVLSQQEVNVTIEMLITDIIQMILIMKGKNLREEVTETLMNQFMY